MSEPDLGLYPDSQSSSIKAPADNHPVIMCFFANTRNRGRRRGNGQNPKFHGQNSNFPSENQDLDTLRQLYLPPARPVHRPSAQLQPNFNWC